MEKRLVAPFIRLAGAGLLALGVSAPVFADTVDAMRARAEPVSLRISPEGTRQCWARYSANSGQARNGMIEEVAFRVPCPEKMTGDFMASLQRALAARGYFDGEITARADPATRSAVHSFQRANGFNSPVLTLETAQRLGLIPIEISRN